MSTEYLPSAMAPPAARDASPPPGKRRLDSIDEPARPLGAKSAALQLRRRRTDVTRPAAKSRNQQPNVLSLKSQDGTIGFVLRASLNGLLVERTQRQTFGTRLVQCMVFGNQATFDRWCDSEPMRFEDPVLYNQLRREGHDALRAER